MNFVLMETPFNEGLSIDADHDFDIDQQDIEMFKNCANGPAIRYPTGCEGFDTDSDGDVDSADYGVIQRCYSGAGNVYNINCAR
jgi:hypothetical protein